LKVGLNLNPTPGMQKTFWEYHKAFDHRMVAWKHEVLFTWQWWLGIAFTIIPWVVWFILRNRNSTGRLLFAGSFVALISLTLDNIGVQLSLWNYTRPVTPAIPSYVPFDFSLMPISIMFLIQILNKRNPWIVGLIYGLVVSFIGEPFFKFIDVYNPVHWGKSYSFPIYGFIYVVAHKIALSDKFSNLEA
jgi:hypothetical protein